MRLFGSTLQRIGLAALIPLFVAQGGQGPSAEQCILDAGTSATPAGASRTINCAGFEETFLLAIPPRCAAGGCGLIADIPGATSPAEIALLNTGLRERTRDLPQPFIVLSAERRPSLTFNDASSDRIFEFMKAVANVFDVDRDRIHIGGFSNGGLVTFDFVCDPAKAGFIASAAPQASIQGILGPACFGPDASDTNPDVPILFFSGRNDRIASFAAQEATARAIIEGIGAGEPTIVDRSPIGNFEQMLFSGRNGEIFETIRYDNVKSAMAGPPNLGGHCYVGPPVRNPGGCSGEAAFENGAKTLEFYMAHPKKR
jgi:hypothetical protein